MNVLRFPLGQMQANCYLLSEENTCLLIDPADDAPFLLEEMQRRNLQLVAMIATHGHFDHVMAAGEIQLSYDVPFYLFEEDYFLVDRLEETASHFLGYEPTVVKPKKVTYLKKGKMEVGHFHFDVVSTPGHTPGSASFYFPPPLNLPRSKAGLRKGGSKGIMFTGDTLFKRGIGRFDFSYSNREELLDSIERIFEYPVKTNLYPGHGEETTIQKEGENKTKELLTF